MTPIVKLLRSEDMHRWDKFVESNTCATFFHLSGWKNAVENVFGHDCYYLYAEKDGLIQGILPLAQVKSWLFGNALISIPFSVYGGIAALYPEVASALHAEAVKLAKKLQVDYLELRNREPESEESPARDLYVTFRKELSADDDANLKAIPRKQRAMVRKGIQAGLRGELDEDTSRFFRIYSTSVRNLGTPVLTRKWFEVLKDTFTDYCEIMTVTKDGNPLSSVMSFYFRDEILPYYGGGKPEARRFKANDFMYWELMRRATERGVNTFDFGRSKRGTGSYDFKRNWGFEPSSLYYEYHLVRAKQVPNLNPLNPKYRYFIKMWRHIPLPVSRVLGPMLSRNLA